VKRRAFLSALAAPLALVPATLPEKRTPLVRKLELRAFVAVHRDGKTYRLPVYG
jgi:hypothetical protein